MNSDEVLTRVQATVDLRKSWIDNRHQSAFRLFNGFIEGFPDLAIDVYARTLVLYNYANPPDRIQPLIAEATNYLCEVLSWIQSVIVKTRFSEDRSTRHGLLVRGDKPDSRVLEHDVWYAVDLQMDSDASLYLDTRALRLWIIQHASGLRVLNTFAYTGSLGVAAKAGGAQQVIHLDRNRKFLNMAKNSYGLNGFPVQRSNFICEDFFPYTSRLRRAEQQFDMVFLDPPFFSITTAGRVDLNKEYNRLVNKVRPLIANKGTLIAINNAIYVSGVTFIRQLEELCQDGYMKIEELIPVSADFSGFTEIKKDTFPADPAPFNHPTKIAVLRIKKKDLG